MDKSSLSDDSLDEKPVNRSGGENPEGDADQGLPPGEAERRREDSSKGERGARGGRRRR
jgi:hypothetical protein